MITTTEKWILGLNIAVLAGVALASIWMLVFG